MTARLKHLISALLLATFFAVPPAHAIDLCSLFFWQKIGATKTVLTSPPAETARENIIEQLQHEQKIPAFLRSARTGEVPVILLNAKTYPALKKVLDNSIGTMVVQQVDYDNDHGLMRVGQLIMDVDSPGHRGFGEINDTGIAWKPLKSYLDRRLQTEAKNYYLIEVGYVLSPQDMADAKFYQLVRRAAIIRIPFTFRQNNIDRSKPNTLSSGEHCFVFCKGTAVRSHIQEIEEKFRNYGIQNAQAFMNKPEVAALVHDSRSLMAHLKTYDERTLNWSMLHGLSSAKKLKSEFGQFDEDQQNELVNWIVGYDASVAYEKLRNSLEMTSDFGFSDMNNKKASFVLIYGKTTDNQAFERATFASPGVSYSWRNENQKPIR